MNTKKQNKTNPLWETFDKTIAKHKFEKLKQSGFEVVDFESNKNYQQKQITIDFSVMYEVEKKKWGICKDFHCVYDAETINGLDPDIKKMKSQMKNQKIVSRGIKRQDVRNGFLKRNGWYIYYLS